MRTGVISVNAFFCHSFELRTFICYAICYASHVRIPFSGRNSVAEILERRTLRSGANIDLSQRVNLVETGPLATVRVNTQKISRNDGESGS